MTARTLIFNVVAPSSGVPSWLSGMGVGAWTSFASGSGTGKTIMQVAPAAITFEVDTGSGSTNSASKDATQMMQVWTGATLDTDRKEMLMVANGGHGDYPGNEAYSLALWANAPFWYRLNAPTPSSPYLVRPAAGTLGIPTIPYPGDGGCAKFVDGRSRAMHNCGYQTYVPLAVSGGGKVWFPHQGAYTSGPGTGGFGIAAFNRYHAGMPLATESVQQPTPQAHDGGAGPWSFYGMHPTYAGATSEQSYAFGLSEYDNATGTGRGLIWSISQYGTVAGTWSVDPATGASAAYKAASDFPSNLAWWAAVPERGVMVRGGSGGDVSVFDVLTKTWTTPVYPASASDGNRPIAGRHHGVYWNGALYFTSPWFYGRKIYRLAVPSNLSGAWSAYEVIDVVGGPATDSSSAEAASWNRLQLVTFGTYNALIVPTSTSTATYAYRLS